MFDEKQVRSQDDELNRRIVSSRRNIVAVPQNHFLVPAQNQLSTWLWQYFQYGFWKVAVIRQHRRFASWRNLVPGASVLVGIILPLCAGVASLGRSIWWRDVFLGEWLGLSSLYFIASFASAFFVARRNGWMFLPFLPIVFATYHLSYGLGFLLALLYRPADWDRAHPMRKALTAITR